MQFETCLKIDSDGDVTFENGKIQILNARYIIAYHLAATDYKPEYPEYTGNDYIADNKKSLAKLEGKPYEKVRSEHQKDYQNLFARVELNLGKNHRDSVPIDRRLQEYAGGTVDPGLEQIYFQYSRYMMIAASRPGSMPLHLQGKMEQQHKPPMGS